MYMFKVGDRVRVREDLKVNTLYGSLYFINVMRDYRGREFKIVDKSNSLYFLEHCTWPVVDEMLEPMLEPVQEDYLSHKKSYGALLEAKKYGFNITKQSNGDYYCTSQCNCCQKSFQYKVDVKEVCGEIHFDTLRLYCDSCIKKERIRKIGGIVK